MDALSQEIIRTHPISILMLDGNLTVQECSESFLQTFSMLREKVIGKSFSDLIPIPKAQQEHVSGQIQLVQREVEEALITIGDEEAYPDKLSSYVLHLRRIGPPGEGPFIAILQDESDRLALQHRLNLLQKVSSLMRGTLDIGKLLFTVLTCTTAGPALGFSRAFLLLKNEENNKLEGKMAVGPGSPQEAYQVWNALAEKNMALNDLIEQYDKVISEEKGALKSILKILSFSLDDRSKVVVEALYSRETLLITDGRKDPRISADFLERYGTDSFLVVPLVCRDDAVGVILADNIYKDTPISRVSINLLSLLANQAAIALNNAYAYQDLQKKVDMLEAALISLQEVHEKLILSEKLAAIGKLAAKVAHEIRNPLATIGGFARSIQKAPGDSDKVCRNTEIIIEEVERLEKLLSNIMDFSRPSEMKMEHFSLKDIVEDSIIMTQNKILEKEVNFSYINEEGELRVFIDGPQVKQVLLNIIQNALDSVEEKGTIRVALQRRNDFAGISVANNGPGIPLEDRDNIFKPFYTTKTGGTGLGLCISKEIIENHGGRIEVNGGDDKFTIFTVYLPLEKKLETA